MRYIRAVALTFVALLISGCGDSNVLLNMSCKHDCLTLDNIENQDEATIQQRLKAACEGKGAPKINERKKTVIAAQCGE